MLLVCLCKILGLDFILAVIFYFIFSSCIQWSQYRWCCYSTKISWRSYYCPYNLCYANLIILATILFQLVTLPVEIDASARAREQLNNLNITISEESDDVKRMLNAAAMTYIASLISSLAQLLRLIIMFREDDK